MQRGLEAERRHSREVVHERDRSMEESARAVREVPRHRRTHVRPRQLRR